MITIISLSIVLYLISIKYAYLYIQKVYFHKLGWLNEEEPNIFDFIGIFIPFFNTLFLIKYIKKDWMISTNKKINFFYVKFFKPNKFK